MDASIELYELNRSIIEQQGIIDSEVIPDKMAMMKKFVEETENKFYMLYGKEIGYFTVFVRNMPAETPYDIATIDLAVFECLSNVGPIYSIELTPNNAIEIWVKDTEKDLLTCMYLFPYDEGIVRLE